MSPVRTFLGHAKRAVKRRLVPRGLILTYHRVAAEPIDPWRLCVTPENFAGQLEVLRELRCKLVPASGLAKALAEKRLAPSTVAVTFDDGYFDNLESGQPLLQRYSVPATLFATAGYIGRDEEFWWDVPQRIFLEPGSLPATLELSIKGSTQRWELGQAADLKPADALAWPDWKPFRDPPTMRHRLHDELWRILFGATVKERERLIDELLQWAGLERHARPSRRPLSEAELRKLGKEGWVEIGGHSMTHTSLAGLPPQMQAAELSDSKQRLEEILGSPVLGFSYPQGGSSPESQIEVRKAGYAFACGSDQRSVRATSNLYELPRVSVGNWSPAKFRSFVEGHLAA